MPASDSCLVLNDNGFQSYWLPEMKQPIIFFTIVLLCISGLSGCVYYPQAVDIPLISEKNDCRIDAGISTDVSAHTTVSYGLTDKIAVQGFARYGADEKYYYQGAVGLYKKYPNDLLSEGYAGFGYGISETQSAQHDAGELEGNFRLYFLQWNVGKKDRRFANVDYGIGLKGGLLSTSLTDKGWWDESYNQTRIPTRFYDQSLVLEPHAVFRIGSKHLKFNVKLGACWLQKLTHQEYRMPYGYWNAAIGLNYHF